MYKAYVNHGIKGIRGTVTLYPLFIGQEGTMKFVVNNSQMKEAERRCSETHISYEKMMENAGVACAKEIAKLLSPRMKTAVLCGSGNNGGDGLVIARELAKNGFDAAVILVNGEPRSDCAKSFFPPKANVLSGGTEYLKNADAVVDCIYGTGFHGSLPDNAAELIAIANTKAIRAAVDVPSGINSDTGEMDERCFKPTHTLVIAAMKRGLLVPECNDILGEIKLLDIDIPDNCYENHLAAIMDDSFRRPFPERRRNSHKGTYGYLLNIAGSFCYSGAAAMSTKSALRSGVGLCALASPKTVVKMLAPVINESTYLPLPETEDGFADEKALPIIEGALEKATAVLVGCGMGNSENTRKITEFVIRNAKCPVIIDADGINSISRNIDVLRERTGETILTPHPLEFSRMSGLPVTEIQRGRIEAAVSFAKEYGAVTVLKGAYTVAAAPDGSAYVCDKGNAGLAKGGSGDTLAGIIGAMAAQKIEPFKAAACGVYCHALAADIALKKLPPEYMLAGDVTAALAEVFGNIT